jgi:hypothetical protein
MRHFPLSALPVVVLPVDLSPVQGDPEPAAMVDRTAADPVLRRAVQDARGRLRRRSRRDRIAAKRSFLDS